ncbi:MAG TPA: thiamine phosphate synthase [Acidobacteriota bacterium]|jgi:thiamine-phosphate pyrophosphorylase|nr:thiamine phosphate synthase [Acidobacteriota bacterium]HRV06925.1 thiamine phosphate synthase [Acidobacteriota bacterium]
MESLRLGPLYPITAEPTQCGRSLRDQARIFLEAGIPLFQVRSKKLPTHSLFDELVAVNRDCRRTKAQLIVNDRLDLALAARAAGVHLGQEDLPVEAARQVAGTTVLIGISTHNAVQFEEAQSRPVDYVALGPIFASETKPGAHAVVGLEALRRLASHKRKPLVAVGGITLESAPLVWAAGADAVAVIGDIAFAADPVQRIRAYLDRRHTMGHSPA